MNTVNNQSYIDAYYTTNQIHLKWSFWVSLIALAIGLVVLVIGTILALLGSCSAVSIVTAASGIFTQFISVGFFFLYSKNLKQLNVFYDKLIRNQDTLFALSLVGHIPEIERSSVIQAIIVSLLSIKDHQEITPELVKAFANVSSVGWIAVHLATNTLIN